MRTLTLSLLLLFSCTKPEPLSLQTGRIDTFTYSRLTIGDYENTPHGYGYEIWTVDSNSTVIAHCSACDSVLYKEWIDSLEIRVSNRESFKFACEYKNRVLVPVNTSDTTLPFNVNFQGENSCYIDRRPNSRLEIYYNLLE